VVVKRQKEIIFGMRDLSLNLRSFIFMWNELNILLMFLLKRNPE
jgi:hypothetical protein